MYLENLYRIIFHRNCDLKKEKKTHFNIGVRIGFVTTTLACTLSTASVIFAQGDRGNAPTATAEEAQIRHWEMPVTKKKLWEIPMLKKAFTDTSPADRNDGIPVGELGVDGGNKETLEKLVQEISELKYGKYDSILIAQNGKLLFESYFRYGRVDLSHPQSSATKSYTGLALGRAIQLGYLTMADLDKPLDYFLKDLDSSKFVKGAEMITLRHALTMTTGIQISDDELEAMRADPDRLKGQGQVQTLLETSAPITPDMQVFSYSAGPQLVMQVIEAVVPGSAKDFIRDEFLGKMGITNYDWQTAVTGLPESGWKASLTSRDMVKIGLLVINNGRWKGEQLIPEAFITKATDRINYSGDDDIFGGGKDVSNQGYGYFWWSADLKHGDESYFAASAQGGGGQYIILIRELDLVIVTTAHEFSDATQQLTAERIIPVFVDEYAKPEVPFL